LYVSRYADEVTVIYRGARLRAEQAVQEAVKMNPKISVHLNQEVAGVEGDDQQVQALRLQNRESGEKGVLKTDGVFVGIGMKPNSEIFDGLLDLNEEGFIRVNARMETSVPGIYGAGDVIDKTLRQIVTAAGDGAVAADTAIKYIEGTAR
jgi:thioredoxin reductase (NADPH)